MTPEEASKLKPGDTIYLGTLPVKYKSLKNTVVLHFDPYEGGLIGGFELVHHFSTRPMVPQPKYDPCRLFKKGDKVRVVEYKGRKGSSIVSPDTITTVESGEEECDWVYISVPNGDATAIDPAYLELVTPVEELEPYKVVEDYLGCTVCDKDKKILARFFESRHPNPKAAAEAERDRLNAEYRKEQK